MLERNDRQTKLGNGASESIYVIHQGRMPRLGPSFVASPSDSDESTLMMKRASRAAQLIRKSDTLATFCKTLLKVKSAFVTLVKVLIQAGSSLHLAVTCSLVLLSVQGITTFRVFTPIAEKLLKRKSERDEASEQIAPGAEEKARLYTSSPYSRVGEP
ncbi:hypothetical protein ACKVWC_011460 [Pyricularia oryzae]